jgi:hypothetical protein
MKRLIDGLANATFLYDEYPFNKISNVTFLSFTSLFYNVKNPGWKETLGVFTIIFDLFFDGNRINTLSSLLLGASLAAYPITVAFSSLWLIQIPFNLIMNVFMYPLAYTLDVPPIPWHMIFF